MIDLRQAVQLRQQQGTVARLAETMVGSDGFDWLLRRIAELWPDTA
jgi:hypothetical protein